MLHWCLIVSANTAPQWRFGTTARMVGNRPRSNSCCMGRLMGLSACSDKSHGPLLADRPTDRKSRSGGSISISDTRGLVRKQFKTTQGLAVHAGITVGMRRHAPGTAVVEWVYLLNFGAWAHTQHPAGTRLPTQRTTVLRNVLLSTAERSMFDRGAISFMPCFPFWPQDNANIKPRT